MARLADTVDKGPGLGELLCEGRSVVRTITLQTCQRPPLGSSKQRINSDMERENNAGTESGEKHEEIICTGILTDRGTIKVDVPLLNYFEEGEKVKVTIFVLDQEDPAL